MKKVVLLLTGTVNPGQMAFTKLVDPSIRREQYISSINYWLEETDLPIIFVENSGTDFSKELKHSQSGRIEFLTFNGNDYSKTLGKGHGELKCLQYVSENSIFFKECDFIFKVTGRNKILNFENFYNYYLKHTNTFIFLDLKRYLTFAESRIFGFKPSFISTYLIKHQDKIDDSKGVFFENILAKAALEAIIDENTFEQFPFYPKVTGFSGTDNRPYRSSYFYFLAKQMQLFLKAWLMKRP